MELTTGYNARASRPSRAVSRSGEASGECDFLAEINLVLPRLTTMFIQFGDPHVMMINQDYLVHPGGKSNLIIQTNDCNWNC